MVKCTPEAVIATAQSYIGYLEKKSNANLDDFTKNAGSANYTRFNRDLIAYKQGIGAQPMEWCGSFVSCMFVYTFGLEAAKKLLCGGLHCYTPSGADYFKKKGRYYKRGGVKPRPGDVIFFYSSAKGRIGHVGIVYKVGSSTVYTIEGNTSGASALVTNGGGVKAKSYSLTSSYIDGYGRPDYDGVMYEPTGSAGGDTLGKRILKKGCIGSDVEALQLNLITLGYSCGRCGADGEFGGDTEAAVKAFQKASGLEVDGEYGEKSHAAMVAALAKRGGKRVRITGGQCWVRTAPNTAGAQLGVAKEGTTLPYGGETSKDGWLLVEYENKNGWVSGKYGKVED